ncbi:MAG: hypothetical protein JWN34_1789 [Bryobacterales bacterium]|nr:hypothetical protein [Bryobacterales bacterium]
MALADGLVEKVVVNLEDIPESWFNWLATNRAGRNPAADNDAIGQQLYKSLFERISNFGVFAKLDVIANRIRCRAA